MFEIIESLFKKLQDKKWITEDTETLPDIETTPSAPPRERPDKPINPVVPGPSTNPKPKATVRDVALFMKNHNLAESVNEKAGECTSCGDKAEHLYAGKYCEACARRIDRANHAAAMDFTGQDEPIEEADAIHPDKKAWIKSGDELINQILPKVTGKKKTYLQTIASESYNDLVAKIQQYTGIDLEPSNLPSLIQLLFRTVQEVIRIEKQHKNYLEEWAVMLPLQLKEFKLVEEAHTAGSLKIVAKLENPDYGGKMNDAPPENEEELTAGEELNMAMAVELGGITEADIQRRFANMLISGGAGLKLYLYNLMNDRLTGINPQLPNMYGMLACLAQLGYWVTPDGIEHGALESNGAGMEEIAGETEGVKTINATGVVFPYLVHEVVKGIYEWLSLTGEQHADISSKDKLGDETKDLMVGGKVWQAVNSYLGDADQELMPLVQKEVIRLSPEQIQAVLAKDVEGKKIMDDILVRSRQAWKTYQTQKEEYAKESADTLHQSLYLDLARNDLDESVASLGRALKAKEITQEQHDALLHADPSPGKIYVDWMKKIMLKDKIEPAKLASYFDGLHTFYILAANQHSPFQDQERNIASYRTMAEVNAKAETAFNNLPEEAQGEMARNIRRKVVRKEVDRLPQEKKYVYPRNLNDTVTQNIGQKDPKTGKIIKDLTSTVVQFENDKCIVVMPRTKEKSIKYGTFGGWCTAKPAGQNQFHTYWDRDEALLYIIPKGKFATSLNNWCIQMDPNGKPIKFWDFQDQPHEPNDPKVKAMMKRLGIEE